MPVFVLHLYWPTIQTSPTIRRYAVHCFFHRLCRCPTLLLLLLVGGAPLLRAQGERRPALGIAYEFGVPNSVDRTRNLVNLFAATGGGHAYDHTARIGLELVGADPLGAGLDAALRISLGGSTGLYRSVPFTTVDGRLRDYQLEVKALSIGADLRLLIPITSRWSLDPGAWLSYRVLASYIERLRNLDSVPMPFSNGTSTVIAEGDTLGSFPLRFGLLLSSRFTIPISSSLQLSPEIYTRMDLLSIGLGVRAFSIGAGVAFRFGADPDIGSAEPARELPEHVEASGESESRSDAPRAVQAMDSARPVNGTLPQLSASVDLRAIDADGMIRQWGSIATELERRRVTLMPPAILRLDPARVMAPSGSPSEHALFADSSGIDLYQACVEAVLDALGARMRRDTSALIMLRGQGGRRDAARDMLAHRWGIVPERIVAAPRTFSENSGDSLLDLMPAHGRESLFAPIEKEWLVRSIHIPRLEILPEITASVGVRRWRVSVRHGERIVGGSSSDGGAMNSLLAIEIPDLGSDSTIAPFVADLLVEDSTGSTVMAHDTLPLRMAKEPTVADDRKHLVWKVVFLESPSSCRSCADSIDAMLEMVAAAIAEGDRIVVGGIGGGKGEREVEDVRRIVDRLSMLLRGRGVAPRSLAIEVKREINGGSAGGSASAGAVMITVVRRGTENGVR